MVSNAIDIHVGAKVRLRRETLGLSVGALAWRMRVGADEVVAYEAGTTCISATMLFRISQALGAPVAYFYSDIRVPVALGFV
jgi:transcriptional regulator with XRE-family HTH domain